MVRPATNTIPSIGPYRLDAHIGGLANLVEFSSSEYRELPKRFPDEQIFNAPPAECFDDTWKITLAVRGGYIRKIFAEKMAFDLEDAELIVADTLRCLIMWLGEPTEKAPMRAIWDASFGNLILTDRSDVLHVSVGITSRLEIQSEADRNAASPMLEQVRNLEFIGGLHLTNEQMVRWLWLRSVEWSNLPSFASQPIVPLLLLIFKWPFVVGGVFASNALWALVRYRYVSVKIASYTATLVGFTKWPAAICGCVLLVIHHRVPLSILALAWPMGLSALIAIPGKVGKLQKLFAREFGPVAECLLRKSSD